MNSSMSRSAWAAGSLVAAVAALTGCGGRAPQAFERPPAVVSVAEAVVKDVPTYLDGIGKTVAREVVSIQPQVSGRITEIHFTDGADLKIGDPLFTIDPRPYQAQLDSADAAVAQAKATQALARTDFARAGQLIEAKAVSQQ